MRNYNKMISAFTAGIIAFTGLSFAAPEHSSAPMNANAADDTGDDWLHAVGSRLYDSNGNQVWLTGANWFGMNCTENVPHGLYARDVDDLLQSVADHGINIIRFPISTELLLSWMDGDPLPVSSVQASYNPPTDELGEDGTVTPAGKYGNINREFCEADGKTLKNSYEIFKVIIAKCKKYGIKALIDVHSPASHNSGHNYNLWYYEPTAEDCDGMATGHFSGKKITWDDWKDSITWLAEQYANDDTILAYDLKNEPHGKRGYDGTKCPSNIAKWDDSTDKNNWKYSSEECAKSILKVNPHALILIEGIEQSPMFEKNVTWDTADVFQPKAGEEKWYGAWWGGNLRGVKNLPVLPDSGQIVYSPHDYGPSVYAQTWFAKEFDTDSLLKDYWYDTWAYINDQDIAPLLIGEWGGHMDEGKNQKWMELLREYMVKNHINHTFWCLNPNSGDTGGLLDSTFMNWDDNKYSLFEESLWQTDGGKYIGLDHKTALGANGVSLSDFYSSGAKSNLNGGSGAIPEGSSNSNSGSTQPKSETTTSTSTTSSTTSTSTTTPNNEITMVGADFEFDLSSMPEKVVHNLGEEPVFGQNTFEVKAKVKYSNNETVTKTWNFTTNNYTLPMEVEYEANGQKIKNVFNIVNDFSAVKENTAGKYPVYLRVMDDKKTTTYAELKFEFEYKASDSTQSGTESDVKYGDANCDGDVNVADSVLIMQSLANPSKFGADGTDENKITAQGKKNADCSNVGDGVTNKDALAIQKYKLQLIDKLPE